MPDPVSAIPAAIDFTVAGVRALPACAAPVTVHDGWPVGSGQTGIAIGVRPSVQTGNTDNEQTFAQLGANMEREIFDIPCEIAAYVGGAEEAAKPARDAAFAIYNAVLGWVRNNRTLGGIQPGIAQVINVDVDQTAAPEEAGEGRVCQIRFAIRCEHRL